MSDIRTINAMVTHVEKQYVIFVGLATKHTFILENPADCNQEFQPGQVLTAIKIDVKDPLFAVKGQDFKSLYRYKIAPEFEQAISRAVMCSVVDLKGYMTRLAERRIEDMFELPNLKPTEIYLEKAVCISFIDWSATNEIKEVIFQCPKTARRGKLWENKKKRGHVKETFVIGKTYGPLVVDIAAWGDKKDTTWNGPENKRAHKIVISKSKFLPI